MAVTCPAPTVIAGKLWKGQVRVGFLGGMQPLLDMNGLLPVELRQLLPLLDYVSMDFKAPTATGLAAEATWERHRQFLAIAQATNLYGKFVVTSRTTDEELDSVVDLIASVNTAIPLILQPVTPFGYEIEPVSPARMIALHARSSRRLAEVRVIPQTHKMMKLL